MCNNKSNLRLVTACFRVATNGNWSRLSDVDKIRWHSSGLSSSIKTIHKNEGKENMKLRWCNKAKETYTHARTARSVSPSLIVRVGPNFLARYLKCLCASGG